MPGAEHGSNGQINIVPFRAEHLLLLDQQDAESYWGEMLKTPEHAEYLETLDVAHTLMRGEKILCCAGLVPQWEGRVIAWAMMARKIGRDYIYIHRAVERWLKLSNIRRIETTVDCSFTNGIRWAEMLGFVNETPDGMKGFAIDGRPHFMFARVS